MKLTIDIAIDGASKDDDLGHSWEAQEPGRQVRQCSGCGARETYWDDDAYPIDLCPAKCHHSWTAGMMHVHPEDAAQADAQRKAAGEDGVICQRCDTPLPSDFDPDA